MKDFHEWLAAKGFDPETITAAQKVTLQAAWRAENADPPPAPAPKPVKEPDAREVKVDSSTFDEKMKAIEAENERIETIRHLTFQASQNNIGNPEKVKQLRGLCDAAILDQKTSVKDFQLALLRADRSTGPIIMAGSAAPQLTDKVIEAAVCRAGGLETLEKNFDTATLEASEKHFKHGLGLQELMGLCARHNGWRGASLRSAVNSKDFFRAAFNSANGGEFGLMAGDAGTSTYSLPNILGNIANKFLRIGFENYDQAWRMIASTRSVNDFKTITTATLTGALTYKKLAPSGEIKQGTLTELSYTNKADTYAMLLGIARTDLINDDLSALSTAGRRLGRGAATKINDIFWTVFLNNSSFFASGNSNVSTGAGSALASAGLKAADRIFRVQTDQEGLPIGYNPSILLVPPTLWYTARELMNSSLNVGTTTANSLLPATNIFQGAYTVVTSAYMENTTYTGNSTAAWYLLASPSDLPVIEGVFVNGRDTPTVDTADADFNMLGISMRGYIDFGFSLQEYRGGVRSAGS